MYYISQRTRPSGNDHRNPGNADMKNMAWITDNEEEMCLHVMRGEGDNREYMAIPLTIKTMTSLTASLLDLVRRHLDAR